MKRFVSDAQRAYTSAIDFLSRVSLMENKDLEELRAVFVQEAARHTNNDRTALQMFANISALYTEVELPKGSN